VQTHYREKGALIWPPFFNLKKFIRKIERKYYYRKMTGN